VMTNESSALLDTDAHNKALDADAALQELGSDLIGEAYVTATVTVWDEDARTAVDRLPLLGARERKRRANAEEMIRRHALRERHANQQESTREKEEENQAQIHGRRRTAVRLH